jgi:hypothetical protein
MKKRIVVLAGMAVFLSGCDLVPPEYEKHWIGLQKQWRDSIIILTRGPVPEPAPSGGTDTRSDDEAYAKRVRDSKANGELLHEVLKVVYMREPEDRAEFGNLLDSMSQGASLEGLYNGFTHSTGYRKLEMANSGASTEALKVFGRELAVFELELPTPVEFSASATQPLAMPVEPGVEPAAPPTPDGKPQADGVNVIEYGKPVNPGAKVDLKTLAEKYSSQFVGASIFTLKRILGDEALKVVELKRQYPEKFAHWYADWVSHMAELGVDFGVSQRNKADVAFHYKWALTAPLDRVNWEVLNRVHRALNDANRHKQ